MACSGIVFNLVHRQYEIAFTVINQIQHFCKTIEYPSSALCWLFDCFFQYCHQPRASAIRLPPQSSIESNTFANNSTPNTLDNKRKPDIWNGLNRTEYQAFSNYQGADPHRRWRTWDPTPESDSMYLTGHSVIPLISSCAWQVQGEPRRTEVRSASASSRFIQKNTCSLAY